MLSWTPSAVLDIPQVPACNKSQLMWRLMIPAWKEGPGQMKTFWRSEERLDGSASALRRTWRSSRRPNRHITRRLLAVAINSADREGGPRFLVVPGSWRRCRGRTSLGSDLLILLQLLSSSAGRSSSPSCSNCFHVSLGCGAGGHADDLSSLFFGRGQNQSSRVGSFSGC